MIPWPRWLRRQLPPDAPRRWICIDTETTGLDPDRDVLLAIGAVAVNDGCVAVDDSFEVTLRQTETRVGPDILVHGIGVESQLAGLPPAVALQAFGAYAAASPCVAFHAAFDRAVLRRAIAHAGGAVASVRGPWLDLAELAPALLPRLAARCRALDDWLSACAIDCDNRHNAVADALATAQLLAYLLPIARRQGIAGFEGMLRLAHAGRWMNRRTP